MKYIFYSVLWLFPTLLYAQSIFDLQRKSIILAPLRDSSYIQSVYTPEVVNKWKFNKEYRTNTNVYGKPIYIDSVYTIFSNSKKKKAIIIDINVNGQQLLYHLPCYYNRTKEKLSFMWHDEKQHLDLLRRPSLFDKNSYYSKTFGTTETVDSADISFRYYDYDSIQYINSSYKDSLVTIELTDKLSTIKYNKLKSLVLRAKSFEFIFKKFIFKYDDEINLYKNEGVYPLCMALQSTKTSETFYLPIATTHDYYDLTLSEILHLIKRKYDAVKQLSVNSEFIKPIINSIGQEIYIERPNSWINHSIKWWYNPIEIFQYTKNTLVNESIGQDSFTVCGTFSIEPIGCDSFIDCVLYDIEILPNVLKPTSWNLGGGRVVDTFGTYQYYAKILPHPSRKQYGTIKNDTLLIPIDYQSATQFWNTNQFDSLINIREHETEMSNIALRMPEKFNLAYASSKWNKEEVNQIINKRQIKFGYSIDMCLMAYRGQEYKVSIVSLPIGRAKRYHFLKNNIKLYFRDSREID